MIRKVKDKYVIFNKDGTKKLYSTVSYQDALNRLREIEYYRARANAKKAGK